MDKRLGDLQSWLERVLSGASFKLEPASGDASFRRYFRVTTQEHSMIAMDAPVDKEDSAPFLKVAGLLAECGINVPRIVAAERDLGFMLLTDLGSHHYLDALLRGTDVERLYEDAISALVTFQSGVASTDLPPYDRGLLDAELCLFKDWLLGRHLGISLDKESAARLSDVFELLVKNALAQPGVFVHRDYHSRNLMVCPGSNPGVLDFQDAVAGPVSYDLASLLKDCYIKLPAAQRDALVKLYFAKATAAGVDVGSDQSEFLTWFDLMGVQRHLKASGIFARLWHRDGKQGYLADIPLTLSYIVDCAHNYPQLAFLSNLIEQRVLPGLEQTDNRKL